MESKVQSQLREALLEQPVRDFLSQHAGRILDGADEATSSMLRAVRTAVVLAIGCELLRYADVSEATVLGFKFTNLALLLKVTPALISFQQSRIISEMIRRKILLEASDALVHAHMPGGSEAIVSLVLQPAGLMSEAALATVPSSRHARSLHAFRLAMVLVLVAVPAGFVMYEMVRAFSSFGFRDTTLWLSAALSVLFLTQALFYLRGSDDLISPPKKNSTEAK